MSQRIISVAFIFLIWGPVASGRHSLAQDTASPATDASTAPETATVVADGPARQLFDRFLERLNKDTPVSGVFEVRGAISEDAHAKLVKTGRENAATNGMGYIAPPKDPRLVCRWAWDGERELLESTADSTVFEAFLSTPDAYLQGMVERNYNLSGPEAPYPVRPASFYFLMGTRPWTQIAKDAKVEFDDATSPEGTKPLRLTLSVGYVRLFVRDSDFRHQGHEIFLNDKIFHRLRITSFFENSNGQAFPDNATLEVFNPESGAVLRSDELRAVKIQFPKEDAALQSAFAMDVPAGSEVHDLLLNKEISLAKATPVADVISGAVDDRWVSMEGTGPIALAPTPNATSRRWLLWGNIVALTVIAGWIFLRARRRQP